MSEQYVNVMPFRNFKTTLAATASVSTILQFLSGVLICRKIIIKGTCGDTSCLPFVVGFVSCSLWLRYGVIIEDISLIFVNSVGALLQLSYVFIYLLYSSKKIIIVRQLLTMSFILVCALAYAHYEIDVVLAKYRIGLICCTVTLLFFIAPFSVLAQVIRTKSAEILPFPLILTSFLVSLQWFVYGVILEDSFVQIPNGIGCTLSAIQLSLFAIYPKSKASKIEKWASKEIVNRIL